MLWILLYSDYYVKSKYLSNFKPVLVLILGWLQDVPALPLLPNTDCFGFLHSCSNKSICCCWVIQSWLTLWDPTDCSTPGFPVLHSPGVCSNSCPVSWWCHPTIASSCPLLLLLSIFHSIRVFSNELSFCIKGKGMERWKMEVTSLAKRKGRRWNKLKKITNSHLRRGDVVGLLGGLRVPLEETRHEFNSSQLGYDIFSCCIYFFFHYLTNPTEL